MKNIIATMIVCSITMLSNAECYRLKTFVIVDVLNDAKECVGKKSLKAGTIVIVESSLADNTSCFKLKPSGISVQEFKRKPTKGAVFKAIIGLGPSKINPSWAEVGEELDLKDYCILVNDKHLNLNKNNAFLGFIRKKTYLGKKIERRIESEGQADCYIKVSPLKLSKDFFDLEDVRISIVSIDDIEFL